jgi:hypothetical protein
MRRINEVVARSAQTGVMPTDGLFWRTAGTGLFRSLYNLYAARAKRTRVEGRLTCSVSNFSSLEGSLQLCYLLEWRYRVQGGVSLLIMLSNPFWYSSQ